LSQIGHDCRGNVLRGGGHVVEPGLGGGNSFPRRVQVNAESGLSYLQAQGWSTTLAVHGIIAPRSEQENNWSAYTRTSQKLKKLSKRKGDGKKAKFVIATFKKNAGRTPAANGGLALVNQGPPRPPAVWVWEGKENFRGKTVLSKGRKLARIGKQTNMNVYQKNQEKKRLPLQSSLGRRSTGTGRQRRRKTGLRTRNGSCVRG